MQALPTEIFSAAAIRQIEQYAIEQLGVSAATLMERAGEAALTALGTCWPSAQRIAILCGFGNNAGDGYVLGRLARAAKMQVMVMPLANPSLLKGEAYRAYEQYVAAGGKFEPWNPALLAASEVIVDAIFGTGLNRPLTEELCEQIRTVNAMPVPILALDIPSGLHADSGHVLGAAVRAHRTVTFVGLKIGCYVGEGVDYTGTLMFDDLSIAPNTSNAPVVASRIDPDLILQVLPPRNRTTHKGAQGHVLIVAGGPGMAGAARLAGEAALRSGAGLVTLATFADNVPGIIAGCPELICRAVNSADQLVPLLERADVIAIGPGLGQDDWSMSLVNATLSVSKPTIVDADALNILARSPRRRADWILTPHPGEAARLLGWSTTQIQNDRLKAAQAIAARYGGTCVLKGAGTIVQREGETPQICDRGNPGMASAGMGDVLTGVISGVTAQVSHLWDAARVGVLAHAMAGDYAAGRGERGMLATDLFAQLPKCINPLPKF